ncbi:D-alanine--D-alanine ligase [Acidaminobacter sp. JC074]|uniref:D-alanine--D-alanine ligase family protein n=1 Tax=Acidaminobacter sp. JC074 TaxID=2530199 RepID=UPI001F0F1F47|nr:D-alanine--D-alanine ligase family protein [Acidaminobacter sp. JC074]MCH4886915.1 D-alanine--D-alanine ligase [Acidaminobacter sp. JC074]
MKINLGIIFGGQSAEHEVSVMSTKSALDKLHHDKYNITLFFISKEGIWEIVEGPDEINKSLSKQAISAHVLDALYKQDVVFPILHGPHGEDGSIQGLFETLEIPYVGSKVLGSAVCMDKIISKKILNRAGIPTVDFFELYEAVTDDNMKALKSWIKGYPLFVKPSNMGSSVGISKVHNEDELLDGLKLALKYDRRVLIEVGVDAREIECAVLESDGILVSGVGEVIAGDDFYDYDAKYVDDGQEKMAVPAKNISDETVETIRAYAHKAFLEHGCNGLARIDFFVEKKSGNVILNEINTLPGMTQFSMYPCLFEQTGIDYGTLIDKMINNVLR